jgi:hypothetical protein
MGKPRASSEGAEPVSVAEPANDHGAPPQAGATAEEAPPPADAAESKALTTTTPPHIQEGATGLPISQFQDHAHIAITLVQIKRDELQSSFNQVKAEMDGSNQSHEALMAERRLQFETEQNRASEMHAENQDKMKKLLENLEVGLTTLEAAIDTYNSLMQPISKNLRDDEQQGGEQ